MANDEPSPTQTMKVKTSHSGSLNVYIQGDLSKKDSLPLFLTLHDLGGNASAFSILCAEPLMHEVMERSIWANVEVPGQGPNSENWPDGTPYPSMDDMANDCEQVINALGVKYVVAVGEGAGANILARLAMAHPAKLIGFVAVHPTSTSAGLMETIKDKWMSWKLRSGGMNPTVEQYLVAYRYGSYIDEADEKDALIQGYLKELKEKSNPHNLEKFMHSFLNRSDISGQLREKLTCDTLVVTGAKASFLHTTMTFYENCNSQRSSLLKVDDTGDVIVQAAGVLARSLILFCKGIGVLTSVGIPGIERQRSFSGGEGRGRHPSMSEADKPEYYQRRASQSSMGSSGSGQQQQQAT